MDFSTIQALQLAEETLIETLERTDTRRWSASCSLFVLDLGDRLQGNPALAVGVVLRLIDRVRKLPGGDALGDEDNLRQEIERRYRRWQGEEMFAGLARDLECWLSVDEPRHKVAEIAKFIDDHLSERLTTEVIARRFGYSKRYLSSLVQAELGATVRDYVLRRRIRRAQDLVRRGEKVEAAMLQVGYHNKTHFYRAFARLTGHKPGSLRRKSVADINLDLAAAQTGEPEPGERRAS